MGWLKAPYKECTTIPNQAHSFALRTYIQPTIHMNSWRIATHLIWKKQLYKPATLPYRRDRRRASRNKEHKRNVKCTLVPVLQKGNENRKPIRFIGTLLQDSSYIVTLASSISAPHV